MSIVSEVMKFLTPDMVARIASTFGLDKGVIGKVASAAVPALLAGLAKLTSTPSGANQLSQVLGSQQPNFLDSIGNVLGGTGQRSVVSAGTNSLESLLGGQTVGDLTNAVGKFAGVNSSDAKGLLGVLGSAVLGTLGKQKMEGGLDASGLANLLASQKDDIGQALPSGFRGYLGDSDLLKYVTDGVRSTAAASGAAARRTVERSSSASRWLWPALIAVAAAVLAWYFFGYQRGQEIADAPSSAISSTLEPLRGIDVGGTDLGATVSSAVEGIRSAFTSITDAASAQEALPKLNQATDQLNQLAAATTQMPDEVRSALATAIAAIRPTIDQLANAALAIPGVQSVIGPAVEALREKLDALASA
jgi:hypothetical protein